MIQAIGLTSILATAQQPLNLALMLDVPDDIIVERISSTLLLQTPALLLAELTCKFFRADRWTHVTSGRVYHTSYKPPKKIGFDDETGEALVQREDDKEINVRARLKNYRAYTAPLLNFYRDVGILKTVSAPTSHEGYIEIRKILDAHKAALGL